MPGEMGIKTLIEKEIDQISLKIPEMMRLQIESVKAELGDQF